MASVSSAGLPMSSGTQCSVTSYPATASLSASATIAAECSWSGSRNSSPLVTTQTDALRISCGLELSGTAGFQNTHKRWPNGRVSLVEVEFERGLYCCSKLGCWDAFKDPAVREIFVSNDT